LECCSYYSEGIDAPKPHQQKTTEKEGWASGKEKGRKVVHRGNVGKGMTTKKKMGIGGKTKGLAQTPPGKALFCGGWGLPLVGHPPRGNMRGIS